MQALSHLQALALAPTSPSFASSKSHITDGTAHGATVKLYRKLDGEDTETEDETLDNVDNVVTLRAVGHWTSKWKRFIRWKRFIHRRRRMERILHLRRVVGEHHLSSLLWPLAAYYRLRHSKPHTTWAEWGPLVICFRRTWLAFASLCVIMAKSNDLRDLAAGRNGESVHIGTSSAGAASSSAGAEVAFPTVD